MPLSPVARALSVLLIEDQRDVADSLAMYLQIVGNFRITIAYDGESGVEVALRDRPDAIVCDIGLPKKDGLVVGEELTRLLSEKPLLIAVSAYADDAIKDRARIAGYHHYLVKPADPQVIKGLLQAHAEDRF